MSFQTIYWHPVQEVVVFPVDFYSVPEGVNRTLRATKLTEIMLNEQNISDLSVGLYLNLVQQKTSTARLVPYSNSFDLFNLFGN